LKEPITVSLLTPLELASLFRVDAKSTPRWAIEGLIPYFQTPGGHRRYRESDVRQFLGEDWRGGVRGENGSDRLLTSVEAAARLDIQRETIDAWARTDKILYIRTPGGHYRFIEREINKLVAKRRLRRLQKAALGYPRRPFFVLQD